jgi:maleate isomerase
MADAEDEFGLPVVSAATASVYSLLAGLGLPVDIPGAGRLLRPGVPQPA